mgnify:CR=1 FL=1
MLSKIYTTTTQGLVSRMVECEISLSGGMPSMTIVGLPDKAVQESRERVKSAIKNSKFDFPLGKLTINLAPADIHKSGTGFDLPIAIGILKVIKVIGSESLEHSLFIGELALDGQIRGVRSVLTSCLWARDNGFKNIYIPTENQKEAALVSGINIYPMQSLDEVTKHLNKQTKVIPLISTKLTAKEEISLPTKPAELKNLDHLFEYWKRHLLDKKK